MLYIGFLVTVITEKPPDQIVSVKPGYWIQVAACRVSSTASLVRPTAAK